QTHTSPCPVPVTRVLSRWRITLVAAVVAHHLPPRPLRCRSVRTYERFEDLVHACEREPPDPLAHLGLAAAAREEITLEMAAHPRLARPPFHEEQKRAPRRLRIVGLVGLDLDAVCRAVAPLECRRPRMHRHVPADRTLVALR